MIAEGWPPGQDVGRSRPLRGAAGLMPQEFAALSGVCLEVRRREAAGQYLYLFGSGADGPEALEQVPARSRGLPPIPAPPRGPEASTRRLVLPGRAAGIRQSDRGTPRRTGAASAVRRPCPSLCLARPAAEKRLRTLRGGNARSASTSPSPKRRAAIAAASGTSRTRSRSTPTGRFATASTPRSSQWERLKWRSERPARNGFPASIDSRRTRAGASPVYVPRRVLRNHRPRTNRFGSGANRKRPARSRSSGRQHLRLALDPAGLGRERQPPHVDLSVDDGLARSLHRI